MTTVVIQYEESEITSEEQTENKQHITGNKTEI